MDILNNIDPQLKRVFENSTKTDVKADLVDIRNKMHEVLKGLEGIFPKNEAVREEEKFVPGFNGNPIVRVKVYSPTEIEEDTPAVMFIHSGGFFLGMPEMSDELCRNLVEFAECTVVSVDYRLAPENPYPAAFDDCYSVLEWMYSNSGELNIDKDRIAVCGVSAGGALAAAVCLMARGSEEINPCFQVLMYPVLDHRHITKSSNEISDTRTWSTQMSKKAWNAYLKNVDKNNVPQYASPAMAKDLAGLPRTYIAACELDILRDEAIEYAMRLYQANVATELHVLPGTFHAFDAMAPKSDIAIRFDSEVINVFKDVFYNK
ncbi:alpha/beta hydrolase [Alkalibacter mobilis]|uniref:alpha/beta hydrolase n=1 Tax=Alkalibacter mobilis TaxID=2787712 RepID=UPI00189C6EEA|nr:alpha/beta hydrolase [Alkalibacter mobilis]MBF7097444.1 alpha/beta hydrolase [Alkalibacter mobilis]